MPAWLEFLLHIDKHLDKFWQGHGTAAYGIMFLVLFAETGLVITPFLPGDSLLFGLGSLAQPGQGGPNVFVLFFVLCAAALTGDTCNYFIGRLFGHKLFRNESARFLKRSYLDTTHEFFEKHGRKTIILARFVPIVRTFAPFVAGIGDMPYAKFITYSLVGAVVWVGLFLFCGYFIGQLKPVREHFLLAIVIMVIITGAPLILEVLRARRENISKRRNGAPTLPSPGTGEGSD